MKDEEKSFAVVELINPYLNHTFTKFSFSIMY